MDRSWVGFSIALVSFVGADMSDARANEQCNHAPVLETFIPDVIDETAAGQVIDEEGSVSKGDDLSRHDENTWRMQHHQDGSQSIIYCDAVTGRCETIMRIAL